MCVKYLRSRAYLFWPKKRTPFFGPCQALSLFWPCLGGHVTCPCHVSTRSRTRIFFCQCFTQPSLVSPADSLARPSARRTHALRPPSAPRTVARQSDASARQNSHGLSRGALLSQRASSWHVARPWQPRRRQKNIAEQRARPGVVLAPSRPASPLLFPLKIF